LKDMFISSFAWLIVFLILFWFHYPKFLAERKT
jgi:TM2 domain-containing membrane protein YozV